MVGSFFHYNGVDWQPSPITFTSLVNSIDMLSDTSGWGVTWEGEVLRYANSAWSVHSRPAKSPLNDLAMVNSQMGFAVGSLDSSGYGTILRYNQANSSWDPVPSPVRAWLTAIDMVDATDGWIVGVSGTFVHWDGTAWQGGTYYPGIALSDVDMINSTDGWAVGSGGAIFHWDSTSWSQQPSPTTNSLAGVSMVSSDEGWAVGNQGTILRYKNGTWTVAPSPTSDTLTAIQMLTPSEGWAVGKGGTILKFVGTHDLSTSTLSVDRRHATAGDRLQYTIAVHNSGTLVSPAVGVSDIIPANTTLVPASVTVSQGLVVSTSPLEVDLGNVPAGGTATVAFQVELGNPAACWFAANQATISCDAEDMGLTAVTTVGTCSSSYLPLIVR
jgi:uncharacterized repeat protein (TIGR01451 family)